VAGLLLGGYFFLPRTDAAAMSEAERTTILVYIVNATLVSFLMDNLHERIKKLESDKAQGLGLQPDAES
jgi:hypothetical protein